MLNRRLVEQQGVSEEDQEKLEQLHVEMNFLVTLEIPNKSLVCIVEAIEYKMQDLWGFHRNDTKHTNWLRMKGCTCPVLDNHDYPYTITNYTCPWHGDTK